MDVTTVLNRRIIPLHYITFLHLELLGLSILVSGTKLLMINIR